MLKRLKCLLLGHKWHFICRSERYWTSTGFERSADQFADKIWTILTYRCDKCSKFKEKRFFYRMSAIELDDLIEVE